MLSAFRRNEAVERGIVPVLGLNAPSGAQCFPTWSETDHRILLAIVSMHLLVLDDYRLTSPQAAPQRRLFDGNRHGRFTRPDSSANTMSIRPCSRRIPPLDGHASPTVQAPLSAPVFHRPTSTSLLLPELSQHSSVHSRPIANNQQTRTPKVSAHRSKVDTPKHTAPQGKRSTATHPILSAADYRLPDPAFPKSCPCVTDAGRL